MIKTMLEIAAVWAKRGTCAKRQVGCVIADYKGYIIASGYNGQPRGYPHCDKDTPCNAFTNPTLSCMAIHAEMNALMRCPNVDIAFSIFITEKPCDKCRLMIMNTGIEAIYYPDGRGDYYVEHIKRAE
jgi:dCMP deaminase